MFYTTHQDLNYTKFVIAGF